MENNKKKTTTQQQHNNTTITTAQHHTYILQLHDNSYYTGITNNMAKRLHQHQSGQSKSTKWHLPVKLIYKETHTTRIAARRLEVKIKNSGALRYLNKLRFTKSVQASR